MPWVRFGFQEMGQSRRWSAPPRLGVPTEGDPLYCCVFPLNPPSASYDPILTPLKPAILLVVRLQLELTGIRELEYHEDEGAVLRLRPFAAPRRFKGFRMPHSMETFDILYP